MTDSASTALRVENLDRSIKFFVSQLGCTLESRHDPDSVVEVSYRGFRFLLAEPHVADLSRYLTERHEILAPGATIFLNGGRADQLSELKDSLERRGIQDAQIIERHWGDRILSVQNPDGFTITFWSSIERTPQEHLALYEAGPDALEEALAGLSSAAVDLARDPSAWTIRQIVHHITDSEATVLARTKFGLAEPGRIYHGNPYHQDAWAVGLDYAHRDIAPALALFRAIRGHIVQLMRHLPDAWDRHTVSPDGTRFSAGQMIPMLVSHAFEHVEEILETRAVRQV